MRNLGILFAELEKTFTRVTSRAQTDGIQLKNFRKSAFAYCASLSNDFRSSKHNLPCKYILVNFYLEDTKLPCGEKDGWSLFILEVKIHCDLHQSYTCSNKGKKSLSSFTR